MSSTPSKTANTVVDDEETPVPGPRTPQPATPITPTGQPFAQTEMNAEDRPRESIADDEDDESTISDSDYQSFSDSDDDEDEDEEGSGVVRTSDLQAQLREVARSGKGKVCLFA